MPRFCVCVSCLLAVFAFARILSVLASVYAVSPTVSSTLFGNAESRALQVSVTSRRANLREASSIFSRWISRTTVVALIAPRGVNTSTVTDASISPRKQAIMVFASCPGITLG